MKAWTLSLLYSATWLACVLVGGFALDGSPWVWLWLAFAVLTRAADMQQARRIGEAKGLAVGADAAFACAGARIDGATCEEAAEVGMECARASGIPFGGAS